jgi:hypothetical protein
VHNTENILFLGAHLQSQQAEVPISLPQPLAQQCQATINGFGQFLPPPEQCQPTMNGFGQLPPGPCQSEMNGFWQFLPLPEQSQAAMNGSRQFLPPTEQCQAAINGSKQFLSPPEQYQATIGEFEQFLPPPVPIITIPQPVVPLSSPATTPGEHLNTAPTNKKRRSHPYSQPPCQRRHSLQAKSEHAPSNAQAKSTTSIHTPSSLHTKSIASNHTTHLSVPTEKPEKTFILCNTTEFKKRFSQILSQYGEEAETTWHEFRSSQHCTISRYESN